MDVVAWTGYCTNGVKFLRESRDSGGPQALECSRRCQRSSPDVLELLRGDLEAAIGKKEADRLFDIANNYGIRHHNRKQMELDENCTSSAPLTRVGDQDNFTHWLTPIDFGR